MKESAIVTEEYLSKFLCIYKILQRVGLSKNLNL